MKITILPKKLTAVMVTTLFAAFLIPSQAAADLLDDIVKRGTVNLCTAALAPWEYKDPASGKWEGFNPDLARLMAKELGVKIKWLELGWGTTIAGLTAGKCDIAWIAFVRTAKRAMVVDFADPHFVFGEFVAVAKDEKRFKSLDELNQPDIIFAARPDFTETLTRKYFPKAQVRVIVGDNPDGPRLEVRAGRADAAMDDGPTLAAFMKQHDWLRVLDLPSFEDNGASWAVRPGNEHLLRFLNAFLVQVKESGELDQLIDKWMKF